MIEFATLSGKALKAELASLAQLRIQIFRAFPYLYEGDVDYEAWYLEDFAKAEGAVVIGAFDGARLIGAATASPMAGQKPEFSEPIRKAGLDLGHVFYFGESVLLPEYRGQGIGHQFFDAREVAAREQGFAYAGFYAVIRDAQDARKPHDYSSLDGFWYKRGYQKLDGAIAEFLWPEVGSGQEISHAMQFWMRKL